MKHQRRRLCLLALPLLLGACRAAGVAPGSGSPEAAGPSEKLQAAVAARLDAFHAAAARADFEAYFEVLAEDAVFIGTDASERWSKAEFAAYTQPYFSRGQGWTYVAVERHVMLSPEGRLAWFDERLENAKYGAARGSGVLRLEPDGRWRLAHYVLSFPIPNQLADDFTARIRAAEPR
jgi:ketosteroid isomerase-like protein